MQTKKYFIFLLLVLLGPAYVHAQTVAVQSAKTMYQAGDSFQVNLVLNTHGQSINTVSGLVDIPQDKFQILDVRYGNSIVVLWVDRPAVDYSKGVITFTGGIPGGYNGSNGVILSFGLKAKHAGSGTITPEDIKLLLNDGQGTELKGVRLDSLALQIKEASPQKTANKVTPPPTVVYQPTPDTTPPEDFIPLVSRHPSIADNKYFVSFSTTNKETGIAYYEVQELPWLLDLISSRFVADAVRSESPYVLQWQWWPAEVVVHAHDQAGNIKEGMAFKYMDPILVSILAGACAFFAVIIFYFYFRRGSKIKKNVTRTRKTI